MTCPFHIKSLQTPELGLQKQHACLATDSPPCRKAFSVLRFNVMPLTFIGFIRNIHSKGTSVSFAINISLNFMPRKKFVCN